jgi:hypothetical protein
MCDGHIGAILRAVTFAGNKLNGDLARWNRLWVEEKIASLNIVCTLTGLCNYLVFSFNCDQSDTVTSSRMCGDAAPVMRALRWVRLRLLQTWLKSRGGMSTLLAVAEQPVLQEMRFE